MYTDAMLAALFKREYRHLNQVLVSGAALAHNHRVLQAAHPEAKIIPVLKSNAYGHGLATVAPVFDRLNAPFLAVDSLYEAYVLAKLHLRTPILILGYTHPANFSVKRLPFHIAVFDLKVAKILNQHQRNCQVHIFVDTGMSREGVSLNDLPSFINSIKQLKNLKVVGLASHLADADNPSDQTCTQQQIENYAQALQMLRDAGIDPQYRHISASAGAFKIKDQLFTCIRAGLASYGLDPLDQTDSAYHQLDLQPALSLVSTLAQIKVIPEGTQIGYNCTFTAEKPMTIGLLPLGYYDGVDRRLSNKGVVLVRNVPCRILGRVSMNMTTIDLTEVKGARLGDQVIVYSSNNNNPNSLIKAAQTASTIPYELLVHLAESIKRTIV